MRRFIGKGSLVVLLSILVCLFSGEAVFAHTHSQNELLRPHQDSEQCLIAVLESVATGSQTFKLSVQVSNVCGGDFSVSMRLNTKILNCPPYAETSAPLGVWLKDQQTLTFDESFLSGCVGCENAVPVVFPPFTVRVSLLAFGSFMIGPDTLQATSNIATSTVNLTNDAPTYIPPCP